MPENNTEKREITVTFYGTRYNTFGTLHNCDETYALKKSHPNSWCVEGKLWSDDAVVVFGGTNDYGHGDATLGDFLDRTPETFYGVCHYLFRGLVKKYLGKHVVIMTPLHRLNETKNTGDAKTCGYGTLKEYVDIIRDVAQYYSLPVLDLYATSG